MGESSDNECLTPFHGSFSGDSMHLMVGHFCLPQADRSLESRPMIIQERPGVLRLRTFAEETHRAPARSPRVNFLFL
jgi:hypothetical protein